MGFENAEMLESAWENGKRFWMKNFVLDRSVFAFGSFADEPDDLSYWLAQSAETRLAGIEFLRRQFYAYGTARPELRRFLEIAQREPR